MKWWKALIAGALFLGVAAIAVRGLRTRPEPPIPVQLATAKRGTITRTITGAGKLQAATTVKISSNISGDLVELLVKEGDRVTKGQVLGRIDRRLYEAAARKALASQSAARSEIQLVQVDHDRSSRERDRVDGLVQKGMASESELERAVAERDGAAARLSASRERHAQAVAAYEEAQNYLSKTTLTSPIDGTVIELAREAGERVRGSDFSEDVVMVIAALSAMEVKIEVGEHEVVHLQTGQKSDVTLDAFEGQSFDGSVVEIAQKALIKNPGTEAEVTTFPVTVALGVRPPGALPGMSAEVRISAQTRSDAVMVPIQAVTVRAERSLPDAPVAVEGTATALTAKKRAETLAKVVFVVNGEGKARVRRVRTGIASDSDLEIIEGLNEGERVVEGPYRTLAKDLQDGDNVEEAKPGTRRPGRGSRG
jgi:HlyD family secretion protein